MGRVALFMRATAVAARQNGEILLAWGHVDASVTIGYEAVYCKFSGIFDLF
jgi:hypothetical protein